MVIPVMRDDQNRRAIDNGLARNACDIWSLIERPSHLGNPYR